MDKKLKIIYNGGLLGKEALCAMGRELVKELDKYHTVKLGCQEIGGYWEKFFNTFKGTEDIYLMNGHVPHVNTLIADGHKVIVPWVVYETDLPKDWVETLNKPEVKLILTISEFCKKKILESGVNKPVEVTHLGLDQRFFKTEANLFPKDKSFKFLHVSAPHCLVKRDRKGIDVLLKAFKEEFGDDPNITLVLKINTIYGHQFYKNRGLVFNLSDYLKTLLPEDTKINNISVITEYLPIETLNQLYNSVDCGVFPSRGEGFGLPQAEMIKLSIPVITTSYSATNEFSDERLRINHTLDSINDQHYGDVIFAEPDKDHLKKLMREAYENSKEEKELAEKFSTTMSKFNWLNVGKKVSESLKKQLTNSP